MMLDADATPSRVRRAMPAIIEKAQALYVRRCRIFRKKSAPAHGCSPHAPASRDSPGFGDRTSRGSAGARWALRPEELFPVGAFARGAGPRGAGPHRIRMRAGRAGSGSKPPLL